MDKNEIRRRRREEAKANGMCVHHFREIAKLPLMEEQNNGK